MKVFYWSPFFSKIATINSVIRSAECLIKYSTKYSVKLINAIGEWDEYNDKIHKKIDIINLNQKNYQSFLPKGGYIKSRFSYLLIFIINFFKLKKLINYERPDYLIIHLMTSLPIFLSIFFTKDTKIILRISGLPKLNIFRFLFWRIFSNRIFKITCPTKATYDNLIKIKLFDYNKVVLLKDPVISLNEFRTKKYKKLNSEFESKKFILSIGRLTKQKNFELLINSFSIIIKKFPYYNLLIIGEGEYRNRLNKLIVNKNLSEKVFLLGYKKNVYKYLKKADFYILTSLWEDPGFVILEAALSNTNIISSDCPNGPREIIKNQDFLFKNNSVEDLVNNFEKIKKKPPNDLLMQKILVKKEIKSFSIYQHFKNLKLILT